MITGQVYVYQDQVKVEDELLEMVNRGPVATTFEVNGDFSYYNGGIFDGPNCCTSVTNPEQCT